METALTMPYKCQTLKLKIRREDDRRVKYTQEEYDNALRLIDQGFSQRAVSRMTGI